MPVPMKLGPHIIKPTSPALDWAMRASIVKAIDLTEPLSAAPPNAIRVFRHYLATQDLANPDGTVAAILAALGGYHHPLLYVELWNEAHPTLANLARAVFLVHQAGHLCCGASWGTGDYTSIDWGIARQAGQDAFSVHCYWGNQGFTIYEALRYRQFWRKDLAEPPVLITECGRDAVEGGRAGWIANGLSATQYAAELLAYGDAIGQDPFVLGATPFSSGPTPDWSNFDMDPVSPLLTPQFSVGPGVAAKLAAEGDTATSDEQYLGAEMSFTTGQKGLYVYTKGANATYFFPKA